jgi:uncharacterized membrane protein (DUF373 family)
MSGLRLSFLFWFMVIAAVGFARYFILAQRDGDMQLAIGAAVACTLVLLVAALELFRVVW